MALVVPHPFNPAIQRNMDRGSVIFTSYPIVKIIFKHLDTRSLRKCAQVCALWYRVSKTEKKRRQDIFWILKVGTEKEQDEIRRQTELCPLTNHSVMESELFHELKNIPIQPVFSIAFMSLSLLTKFKEYFPSFDSSEPEKKRGKYGESVISNKYIRGIVKFAFKDFLPKNCDISFSVTEGIVGCASNCVPLEIEYEPAMSCIFIPKIAGVNIDKIDLEFDRIHWCYNLLEKYAPVKALLVFSPPKYAEDMQYYFFFKNGYLKEVAVGGAFVCSTESAKFSFIVFSGPNVEAASIVIYKKDDIAAKLGTFKETGLLNHKCFAIMFSAVSHGYSFYQEHNVLSTKFCKMYPNVPLIGLFGNKVIGHDYLPNFPVEKTLKPESLTWDSNESSFSSVFVLISFKV